MHFMTTNRPPRSPPPLRRKSPLRPSPRRPGPYRTQAGPAPNADVVAMFLDHYGTLAKADRQLQRATAHGWHLYPVPLPRSADDYRTYEVEITELS